MASQSVVQDRLIYLEIYEAAAGGDMKVLEDRKSEIGSFATQGAKNTILDVYIIAQSRGKEEDEEEDEEYSSLHTLATLAQVFVRSRDTESAREKAAQLSAEAAAKCVRDTLKMLELCPSLLWKVNATADTPLHMAARHGQTAIAKVLIDRAKSEGRDVESGGMRVWEMLHMVNKGKETALHQAVRYQHNEMVRLLVDEDDPDYKHSPNEEGETPLYMAAERGNSVLVKMIVERYNSPAYQGPQGATALHAAAALPHGTACMDYIVEKKGLEFLMTMVDDRGRTPLHYGGTYLLLKHDQSTAFVKDKEGKAAVHVLVARKGYYSDVTQLILHCPDCFELDDDRGRNALHYAVESGDKGMVKLILKSKYLGDLLKKKDKDGLTPLHLLALNRFYMPSLIKDPRLDKMAFNAEDLTPSDIILTSSTHSRIEMELDDSMREAGIMRGWRSLFRSESKINNIIDQDQTDTNNKIVIKPSEGGIDEDDLKEERQNHLVVAALIATVTFAAGFTLPGGYNQNEPDIGEAVLTKETAFQAFVIFNTLAMVLSSVAVFIHLLIAMNKKRHLSMAEVSKGKPITIRELKEMNLWKVEVSDLFGKALPITLVAIVAMIIAFIAGTYAVLSHARLLAIAACFTGSLFFGLFWYLWKELLALSERVLRVVALVLCYIVLAPILLVDMCFGVLCCLYCLCRD